MELIDGNLLIELIENKKLFCVWGLYFGLFRGFCSKKSMSSRVSTNKVISVFWLRCI